MNSQQLIPLFRAHNGMKMIHTRVVELPGGAGGRGGWMGIMGGEGGKGPGSMTTAAALLSSHGLRVCASVSGYISIYI